MMVGWRLIYRLVFLEIITFGWFHGDSQEKLVLSVSLL